MADSWSLRYWTYRRKIADYTEMVAVHIVVGCKRAEYLLLMVNLDVGSHHHLAHRLYREEGAFCSVWPLGVPRFACPCCFPPSMLQYHIAGPLGSLGDRRHHPLYQSLVPLANRDLRLEVEVRNRDMASAALKSPEHCHTGLVDHDGSGGMSSSVLVFAFRST